MGTNSGKPQGVTTWGAMYLATSHTHREDSCAAAGGGQSAGALWETRIRLCTHCAHF